MDLYHYAGRTTIGRLQIYWWWPDRKWRVAAHRFWVGGEKDLVAYPRQTNVLNIDIGPFRLCWWMGA
jgi:hypothetical protein